MCTIRANSLLGVLFFLVGCNCFSGCAVLSIPSYRVGQCSQEDLCQASSDFASSSTCDSESCVNSQCEPELCEDANYVPVYPTIPMPKCIQRWKEHKNLPEGPSGLRFHPLPTRPMFTPSPVAQSIDGAGLPCGRAGGSPTYGVIPRGAQWVEPTQPTGSTNLNGSTINLSELKKASEDSKPSESSTEELPAPAEK